MSWRWCQLTIVSSSLPKLGVTWSSLALSVLISLVKDNIKVAPKCNLFVADIHQFKIAERKEMVLLYFVQDGEEEGEEEEEEERAYRTKEP